MIRSTGTSVLKRNHFRVREKTILSFLLLAGLMHGLVYVFLMPPWEHYDEPGQFEYVWLAANRSEWPQAGEYDAEMRRRVAESMVATGFYELRGMPPVDLTVTDEPVWIGVPQVGDPPLYYFLASLPFRFLPDDILVQLYAGRLVSLLFFLFTVWVSWKTVQEITRPGNPLRWMVPAMLVLLPGFVDVMTALNNDSLAVLVYSLFMWQCIRIVKRKLSLGGVLVLAVLAILFLTTKRASWPAILLLPVPVVLSLFHGRFRLWGWALIGVLFLAGGLLVFQWDDAALWYRETSQKSSTLCTHPEAEMEYDRSLCIQLNPSIQSPELYQTIPPQDVENLRGKAVTIGAWMWADRHLEVATPSIFYLTGGNEQKWVGSSSVSVDRIPTFTHSTFVFPEEASRAYVALAPRTVPDQTGVVHYLTPVLVEGERATGSSPEFNEEAARSGFWDGTAFKNVIRNPGLTANWPRIREPILALLEKAMPGIALYIPRSVYILDWNGTQWYTVGSAEVIFRTFWARFGWGHVPLTGQKPYRIFLFATGLALLGIPLVLRRRLDRLSIEVAIMLGASILLFLGSALFTGVAMESLLYRAYPPVARFIYPAIVPISILLCLGWCRIYQLLGEKIYPGGYHRVGAVIFVAFLLAVDVWSVASISIYYSTTL